VADHTELTKIDWMSGCRSKGGRNVLHGCILKFAWKDWGNETYAVFFKMESYVN